MATRSRTRGFSQALITCQVFQNSTRKAFRLPCGTKHHQRIQLHTGTKHLVRGGLTPLVPSFLKRAPFFQCTSGESPTSQLGHDGYATNVAASRCQAMSSHVKPFTEHVWELGRNQASDSEVPVPKRLSPCPSSDTSMLLKKTCSLEAIWQVPT